MKKNNQTLDKIKIIKDNQIKLEKLIKQSKSNIVIVTGGTGKSDDDFYFQNKNLKVLAVFQKRTFINVLFSFAEESFKNRVQKSGL